MKAELGAPRTKHNHASKSSSFQQVIKSMASSTARMDLASVKPNATAKRPTNTKLLITCAKVAGTVFVYGVAGNNFGTSLYRWKAYVPAFAVSTSNPTICRFVLERILYRMNQSATLILNPPDQEDLR